MVKTRSKALIQKTIPCLENAAIDSCANASDEWDISGLGCVGWKSVKTYSKKQPQQWVSTSRQDRFTPDLASKPDIYKKSIKSDDYYPASSSSNLNSAPKSIYTGKRKYANAPKRFNKASCSKKRNKTTVSVGSMSPCTMLRSTKDDMKIIDQSMSLCSIRDGNIKTCDGLTIRHSTIIAQYDQNVNVNFVPHDISLIEGDEEQRTISSCYNEQTPERQPPSSGKSLKKVKFTMTGENKQMSKIDPGRNPRRRSILKKTPQMQSTAVECPRTSSPDPNKKHALFECDMSSLQDSVDTDKLLDFEPLPLECSEKLADFNRDVTPETCTSAKTFGSGKERRRLSYHPDGDVPVCILCDLPAQNKKKVPVLFGKNKFQLTLKNIKTIPTDILF